MEDAQLAVELGASAIGMVFWPESPRFVDPKKAALSPVSISSNTACTPRILMGEQLNLSRLP